MSLRVRIFLSFLLVQLASAVLILGWYFYSLQAELAALTRNNAQEAVLQSIDSTEDYFLPAETLAEAGRYLLSAGLLGRVRPERLERYPTLSADCRALCRLSLRRLLLRHAQR